MQGRFIALVVLSLIIAPLNACTRPNPASTESPLTDLPPISTQEADLMAHGVQPCWSFDDKLLRSDDAIRMRVTVDGAGRYSSAEIIDHDRYRTDPAFRQAADAVRRSVMNPRCNKVLLPPERLKALPPSFILKFVPSFSE